MWKFNNTLLINQHVQEEIRRKIKQYFGSKKAAETQYIKIYGVQKRF